MADIYTLTSDPGAPGSPAAAGTFYSWGRSAGDRRIFLRNSGTGLAYVRCLAPGYWGIVSAPAGAATFGWFCSQAGDYGDRYPPSGPYIGSGSNGGITYSGIYNGVGVYEPPPPPFSIYSPSWWPWCCIPPSACGWFTKCWEPSQIYLAISGVTAKPPGAPGLRCTQEGADLCFQSNGTFPAPYTYTGPAPTNWCYYYSLMGPGTVPPRPPCGPGAVGATVGQDDGGNVYVQAAAYTGNVVFVWRKTFGPPPLDATTIVGQALRSRIDYYHSGIPMSAEWVDPLPPAVLYDLDTALSCRWNNATCVLSVG